MPKRNPESEKLKTIQDNDEDLASEITKDLDDAKASVNTLQDQIMDLDNRIKLILAEDD